MTITLLEKPHGEEKTVKVMHPVFKKWFYSQFKELSEPQKYSIYNIHCRKNTLVSAPTGSGKTLSAFGSVINDLLRLEDAGELKERVYCIYVSPLRALSRDIEVNLREPLEQMGKDKSIRVAVRTGDTTASQKQAMLKKPPHILITTPETLGIILASKKFSELLTDIEWCIIDEIHALADNKRGVQLSLLMELLSRKAVNMTRIGLSATVAPIQKIAKYLVGVKRDCDIIVADSKKGYDLKVHTIVDDFINFPLSTRENQMFIDLHKMIQSHSTTLIFTNTRSATERIVHDLKERYPCDYNTTNIGAHHGSLSKIHRTKLEKDLRDGKIRVVVCSTSLELGIDIGGIDQVICISSPKSVARFLQRVGRAGHKLHETIKGRLMPRDRDDLIECSVLLRQSLLGRIDTVHIPLNCLDVLAQFIYGAVISEKIHIKELYAMIKQSFCYQTLKIKDFMDVIRYLAGAYVSLEDRYIYAKIWYDEDTGMMGKRGKMARVIYMTNIGTIPEETHVTVKIGNEIVGTIEEAFLEKLKSNDIFVLGGSAYQFRFSKGLTAQVRAAGSRKPTVPRWFSEMLPLSYELGVEIGKLRGVIKSRINMPGTVQMIQERLHIDEKTANAIFSYFDEQHAVSVIPTDRLITIEHYKDEDRHYAFVHSCFGRKVNDCISRAIAFILAKRTKSSIEIGISDYGFYVSSHLRLNITSALEFAAKHELKILMEQVIENTEIFLRRFRHAAGRSLMILRQYKGRKKSVGKQQVGSRILLSAVRRIGDEFPILKETKREILEDVMDVMKAEDILKSILNKNIETHEAFVDVISPFAFHLYVQGYADIMKMEDRDAFLKKLHALVMKKMGKKFNNNYIEMWEMQEEEKEIKILGEKDQLIYDLNMVSKRIDYRIKEDIIKMIEGEEPSFETKTWMKDFLSGAVPKRWSDNLVKFLMKKARETGAIDCS